MNFKYILCHGFGFSEQYWKNLIPLLDGEVIFFREGLQFKDNEDYIGIGHSNGFTKLNNSGINFKYLIGLQGFLNFCGGNPKMQLVRKSNLDKMIKNFKINTTEALKEFYKICGCHELEIPETVDQEYLINELELMKKSYLHCGVKTTIIGSSEDRIVPISLIEDNFINIEGVKIMCIDGIGHSLGFHNSEIVLKTIKNGAKI